MLAALPFEPRAILPLLFFAALIGIPLARALWRRSRRRQRQKLREKWGKPDPDRRRDLAAISALHEALSTVPASGPAALELEETTADDLDLGPLFVALDRTLTEPGQQALHRLLRRPLLDFAALRERGRQLRVLQADAATREELQLRLLPLAEAPPGTLVALLGAEGLPGLGVPPFIYRALALGALASVGVFAAVGAYGVFAVVAAYGVNAIVHYSVERRVAAALPGITALQQLFGAAQSLASARLPGLEPAQDKLRVRLASLSTLGNALSGIGLPAMADSIALYLDIFFLRAVRLFTRAAPLLAAHRAQLLHLVEEVGELDALQAIASFRTEYPRFCEPTLDAAAFAIEAEELRHPLLPEGVPNSLSLGGGALVTGSNMAGKSTFLRTVGLNALLAQTIHTCFAARWSGPALRLATSLRRSDSLIAGRSYYLAEAQGILAALRSTATAPRTLCILDEIFRGTNSVERVAASTEVLRWLLAHGALVLAATHDHALTGLLEGVYQNFHFGEVLGGSGLDFDYRLKEGPALTRNAIELLRFLGYPAELVEAARRAAGNDLPDSPPDSPSKAGS